MLIFDTLKIFLLSSACRRLKRVKAERNWSVFMMISGNFQKGDDIILNLIPEAMRAS